MKNHFLAPLRLAALLLLFPSAGFAENLDYGDGTDNPNNYHVDAPDFFTLDMFEPGTAIQSGALSGSAYVDKIGVGELILTANNTYTGGTQILEGTLSAVSNSAFGPSMRVAVQGETSVLWIRHTVTQLPNPVELDGGGTLRNEGGIKITIPDPGPAAVFIAGGSAFIENHPGAAIHGGGGSPGILSLPGIFAADVIHIENAGEAVIKGGDSNTADSGAGISISGAATSIIKNDNGATISGGTPSGLPRDANAGAGISIIGSDNVAITNTNVASITGGGGSDDLWAIGNGGAGISISQAGHFTIENNGAVIHGGTGTNTGGHGIFINDNGSDSSSILNTNGAVIHGAAGTVGGAGVFISGDNVTITNTFGATISGATVSDAAWGDGVSISGDNVTITNTFGATIFGVTGVLLGGNGNTLNTGGIITGGLTVTGGGHTVRLLEGFDFIGDIGVNAGSLTFDQDADAILSTLVTGAGAIAKTGAATLTLVGANTYQGGTTISGGTLIISNVGPDASVLGTGGVSVGENGVLAGNGTVLGDATVAGVLAPGTSPGGLHFAGDLFLAEDAVIEMELASVFVFDTILVNGSLTFGGVLAISFLDEFAPEVGSEFALFGGGYTWEGEFSAITFSAGGYEGSFNYQTGILSIIPEPGAGALLLLGAGALFLRRRRP